MSYASTRKWLVVTILLAVLAGCGRVAGPTPSGNSTAPSGSVLVLVAASTQDAVQETAAAFTKETGIVVKINADDSSKLALQITEGAPADLFLSANEKWAVFVKDKDLAQESVSLLGNRLVIVVPNGNPASVSKPEDLTLPVVKHVAVAGPTVPAGIYARQALTKLKLWDALEQEKKVVAGENVRVTLTYVERDEAEAGVVYATDARITDKVQAVYTFEAATHDPIVYPLVLLKAAAKNAGGRKFYDYLQSPQGAAIFTKYGFTRLAGNQR